MMLWVRWLVLPGRVYLLTKVLVFREVMTRGPVCVLCSGTLLLMRRR
ncbi:Uncharacterised protein [Mycobacteroides abscessus subsp. bolletii]|nr:Uncharacterised protein [Mycobacteroides abscessus subsp. bolletii]